MKRRIPSKMSERAIIYRRAILRAAEAITGYDADSRWARHILMTAYLTYNARQVKAAANPKNLFRYQTGLFR